MNSSRRTASIIHPVAMDASTTTLQQRQSRVVSGDLKHPEKWVPWMIPVFVIANVVVFGVTMYVNNCPKTSVSCIARFLGRFAFQPFRENPLLGPSSATLQKMGALDVQKVIHAHQGWRLLSCNWLHAGVFHMLANMLSLLAIGIRLEQEFGFAKVGLLYVISGFGGSLLSALFIQKNISVGASGSLFGLLGGMLSELITNWSIYSSKVATFFILVIIIIINLAVGILPHVDNFAHIGGFLSGFFLGFVLLIRPQYGWVDRRNSPVGFVPSSVKSKFKPYQCVFWILSLSLLVSGLTVGLIALLRGVDGNSHCSWCHYLSCVPTSRWSCNNQPAACMTSRSINQLNLTCISNGKSTIHTLPNVTDSQIQGLCSEFCS